MSEDALKISRAISGDLAKLSKEKTGIDLRMIKDTEPLIILEKLRKFAKARNNKRVLQVLEHQEKIIRAKQFIRFSDGLREDISKLGLAFGNTPVQVGIDEEDI